jgi:hypothetical protein
VTLQLGANIKLFSHILQDLQTYPTKALKSDLRQKVKGCIHLRIILYLHALIYYMQGTKQISVFTEEKIAVN